jgi:FkbM family methyltransferase
MRVIDAGANRGVTTVAIARKVGQGGHVYAFEPVPEYYAALEKNLSRNAAHNASAHRLALSNRTGPIRFYRHGEGSGIAPADDAEPLWVEATTVTAFLAGQSVSTIDLLSLDCEGSELLVLQGAEAVLKEQCPGIFCEIHHGYLRALGQRVQDVVGLLTRLGYVVQPLHVERLEKKVSVDECSHIWAVCGSESAEGEVPSRVP